MYRLSKRNKVQGLNKLKRINTESSILSRPLRKLQINRRQKTIQKQNLIKINTQNKLSTYCSMRRIGQNQFNTTKIYHHTNSNNISSQYQINNSKSQKNKYYPFLISKSISKRHLASKQYSIIMQYLKDIFTLCEKIYSQVYQYSNVENHFKRLHQIVLTVGSETLIYKAYAFTGLVSSQYGNISLALFYFDRALKTFYEKEKKLKFERNVEVQIYKCISRIFLLKNKLQMANKFAYKFLRKAWFVQNIDAQMSALDLLGRINIERQQLQLSRYFHDKMCKCKRQTKQLMQMSNQEFIKNQKDKNQYLYYQTIQVFVEKDQRFNQILQDHFRNQSVEYSKRKGFISPQKTIFICTHRSPNRKLANYRVLQRKLIEEKQSKQLHFVSTTSTKYLGSTITEFSKLICETKKIMTNSKYEYLANKIREDQEQEQQDYEEQINTKFS